MRDDAAGHDTEVLLFILLTTSHEITDVAHLECALL